jgi:hypothetical protein
MASIPTNLKYFLILAVTFSIVYWFQMVDDKKRCKERTNIYDKIKLPLLVSAIVGLVLLWNNDSFTAIFVTSNCVEDIPENGIPILEAPIQIPEINIKQHPSFMNTKPSIFSSGQPNFDVYTGLPEW